MKHSSTFELDIQIKQAKISPLQFPMRMKTTMNQNTLKKLNLFLNFLKLIAKYVFVLRMNPVIRLFIAIHATQVFIKVATESTILIKTNN